MHAAPILVAPSRVIQGSVSLYCHGLGKVFEGKVWGKVLHSSQLHPLEDAVGQLV